LRLASGSRSASALVRSAFFSHRSDQVSGTA
jgi:hypothetical protein